MRVSFVSSYLAEFLIPPLNGLAGFCDLSALFLDGARSHDVDYRESVTELAGAATVLSARRLKLDDSDLSVSIPRRTSDWLSSSNPDAVIVLSFVPEVWGAIAWARRRGIPSVMWSESTPWSGRVRNRVSQAIRRRAVAAVGAHLANGTEAERLLWDLGVDRRFIVRSPFPIEPPPTPATHAVRDQRRPLRVLFVGRLVPRKRPLDAISAVNQLNANGAVRAELRVLGDGPLGGSVEDQSRRHRAITWLGRAPRELVRDSMMWADVLVIPSEREVWGLVVNEALREGVFVVSSAEVASTIDLVPDEESGVRFAPGDVNALVVILNRLTVDLDRSNEARGRRSEAAHAHAPAAYDPSLWGESVSRALSLAKARSPSSVAEARVPDVTESRRKPHGEDQSFEGNDA